MTRKGVEWVNSESVTLTYIPQFQGPTVEILISRFVTFSI